MANSAGEPKSKEVSDSKPQGGYEYDFKGKIHDRFFCSICTKVMRNPHLVVCCGQKYCGSCLDHWFKKTNPPTCPHCRSTTAGSLHYVPEKGMKSEIESFFILCPNKSKGCKWTGELREVQKHLVHGEGCLYREVKCPYCNSACVAKTYNTTHVQTCRLFPVECPNKCGKRGLFRYTLPSHLEECEHRLIWCHRKCFGCPKRVKIGEMKQHLDRYCRLRPKKCTYCGLNTTVKNLKKHKDICKKMPLECPNQCGSHVIRHAMNSHLETCKFRTVECKYAKVGCVGMIRYQNLAHHMSRYQSNHLEMMTEAYDDVSEELERRDAFQRERQQRIQSSNWFHFILIFVIVVVLPFFPRPYAAVMGAAGIIVHRVFLYQEEDEDEEDNSSPSFWDYLTFLVILINFN